MHLFFLSILFQELFSAALGRPLRIGFFSSMTDTTLTSTVGFTTNAAAISLAWDRIVNENLLPNFESLQLTDLKFEKIFRIVFKFDECLEDLSAGYLIQLILNESADGVLGPPCSASALVAGTIAKFYDFPLILWGPPFSSDLSQQDVYPTVSSISFPTSPQATALFDLFAYFGWSEFALVFNIKRSGLVPRCQFLVDDIDSTANGLENVTISFRRQLTDVTASTVTRALKDGAEVARIFVFCVEAAADRRIILLALKDAGYDTDEFVFLFADGRRAGFGSPAIWVDSTEPTDGRDDDARVAARKVLVMDNQITNSSADFTTQFQQRMTQYPYNCTSCINGTVGSYARDLADAMYLFAISFNKTLGNMGVNTTMTYPSGELMAANSRVQFDGFSGMVTIGENGTRNPIFQLFALDTTDTPTVFMQLETQNSGPTNIILYGSESLLWATRGGNRPASRPACGFTGTLCVVNNQYIIYVIIGAAALLLVIATACAASYYAYRSRQLEEERLNQLWQVHFTSLIKPEQKKKEDRSTRSLQSSTMSTSTKFTLDSRKDTTNYTFYVFFKEPVAARKHETPPYITKVEAALLRQAILSTFEKLFEDETIRS